MFFAIAGGDRRTASQKKLKSGGFDDPGSESSQAAKTLEKSFGQSDPNVVMVVTANDGTVDDASVAASGAALTTQLAEDEQIDFAGSYWTLGNAPPLRSNDGQQALVFARIGGSEDDVDKRIPSLLDEYAGERGPLTVQVTGIGPVFHEVSHTIEKDLAKAEFIALLITMVLMFFVFGGLVAALAAAGHRCAVDRGNDARALHRRVAHRRVGLRA